MPGSRWIVVAICAACGGNRDSLPDAATPDAAAPADAAPDTAADAAPDAAMLAPQMFGVDPSAAPGESYGDAVALVRAAGVTFLPQAIDWRALEAGPDDTLGHTRLDLHKWDVTGGFAADGAAQLVRDQSAAAHDGDVMRARYTLAGELSAQVDATITAVEGSEATLMIRFDGVTGSRCTAATDAFVAIVLTASASGSALAAATCRNGVFSNDGLATSAPAASLHVHRTPTQLVVDGVATLALSALPAAFAGPGRVQLFAGNPKGASNVTFARLVVGGAAQWDVATDRFVGDPAFDIPGALEAVHGPSHTPLAIILRTINTVTTELPSDLQGAIDPATHLIDLSRPELRARYREAVDYLLAQLPDVPIAAFSVGNEIDDYLGDNATAWAQTTVFASDAIGHVRSKLAAGTPVGITVTARGLRSHAALVAAAEAAANVQFVTYYPLASTFAANDPSVVPGDVDALLAATPKPILFIEAGYPSAPASTACPACTGSEAKQAAFFAQMFAACDAHHDRVLGFVVTWLTDASGAQVAIWKDYYGVSDPTFLAYLASLGVRSQAGVAKPAWTAIAAAAHARGL